MQNMEDFRVMWPTEAVMGSSSLIALHGKPYERVRKVVGTVANDPNALRRIVLRVQPRVVAGLESWAEKGRVLVRHEVREMVFENIGRLFVSLDPGPLLEEMKGLFAGIMKGVRVNPINIPGTTFYRALQCKKRLDEIFYSEMERKNQAKKTESDYDLMDGLMNIQDGDGGKFSDEEVIDNTVALVFAGFESTATASMWAVYYLAKYPDVLKKLREENMALREKKKGVPITFDDISSLKYTNKAVEETLRLANVSAFVFRTVTRDIEYKGYTFPKGWKVMLWLRYFQTNPEYFDDPLTFNPDRWDEPAKPWIYQVFGGGPRTCAGNMLARIQIAILIHHLSIGYKWELVNPDAGVVYLPHPRPSDHLAVKFSRL
uniref:Cytochrome P450 n=1 Tax=Kalanchoe fedtschenkoi TaxID=63787 RepID=A0A7N0VGZ1_KALFE